MIHHQEQPQPGTFEHAVHYLIEHKLDLSVFRPIFRNDDTSCAAYDSAIQCRHCVKKHQCMQSSESANHRKGKGRQVSYTTRRISLRSATERQEKPGC